MNDNYIYLNNSSLSHELCDEIILQFEEEVKNKNTFKGVTARGQDDNVKDTNDFVIQFQNNWINIRKCLERELVFNLEKYMKQINSKYDHIKYKLIPQETYFETFQIQKYDRNKGKYVYHNDNSINFDKKSMRVLTYLWYLNDIEEGGETEICLDNLIKPEKGKLLLFPSLWTYPHSGRKPLSNDKYIITGWLYTSHI